ncbi:MAG: hypothetical protein PVI41_07185 [Roseobacter sp.]
MFSREIPDEKVEKLMSFTEAEFENGLRRFTGTPARKTRDGSYDLSNAAGGAAVTCSFDPQPDAILGGLVRLPRVRVVIEMSALSKGARLEFLTRFERTFQRGGG